MPIVLAGIWDAEARHEICNPTSFEELIHVFSQLHAPVVTTCQSGSLQLELASARLTASKVLSRRDRILIFLDGDDRSLRGGVH